LLVANSNPKEKDLMIDLIINLIKNWSKDLILGGIN
jgi:hypothetical protein